MEGPRTDAGDVGEPSDEPDAGTSAEEDLTEPVLGGPKDDPQEAIAAHSGMWWPPTVDAEPAAEPEQGAGSTPPEVPAEGPGE
jgi:hypothetical protein